MSKKVTVELDLSDLELGLAFANTAEWHASEHPLERLESYEDLVRWASDHGVLGEDQAEQFLMKAAEKPTLAQADLGSALQIRELIYRIFASHATGEPVSPEDLDSFNAALADTVAAVRLVGGEDGYEVDWAGEGTLSELMRPVLRSTAQLLTSGKLLDRVGQCADDRGCGYLYIDMSKNHSRRWCDINDCGNRAKQRRHVKRKRGGVDA